jgi:hypothetical protein
MSASEHTGREPVVDFYFGSGYDHHEEFERLLADTARDAPRRRGRPPKTAPGTPAPNPQRPPEKRR